LAEDAKHIRSAVEIPSEIIAHQLNETITMWKGKARVNKEAAEGEDTSRGEK